MGERTIRLPSLGGEGRKVAEQLAEALRKFIVGGELSPGDPLPSERELAARYEVNRSSVREALRQLEAWGLVEIRHGGATRVRDFLVTAGLGLLPHLFEVGRRLDPDLLRDLHQMRSMLLGWSAERAAERATAADLEVLDALAAAMADRRARVGELQELDYRFFEELVRITGNRLLALFVEVVKDIYLRGRERFAGLYARGIFEPSHHRNAVEAIRRRDPAAASAAMRAHAATALRAAEEER